MLPTSNQKKTRARTQNCLRACKVYPTRSLLCMELICTSFNLQELKKWKETRIHGKYTNYSLLLKHKAFPSNRVLATWPATPCGDFSKASVLGTTRFSTKRAVWRDFNYILPGSFQLFIFNWLCSNIELLSLCFCVCLCQSMNQPWHKHTYRHKNKHKHKKTQDFSFLVATAAKQSH